MYIYDIVKAINQIVSDTYDGSEMVTGVLNRETKVGDPKVMDGFSVRFVSDNMIVKYDGRFNSQEIDNAFENRIRNMVSELVLYIQKQFKTKTGSKLSVTPIGEFYARVDAPTFSANNVRVNARQDYKIDKIDLEDSVFKKFM